MLALACKCLGTCTLSCIGVQDNAVMPGPSWALGRALVGQRIAVLDDRPAAPLERPPAKRRRAARSKATKGEKG